MSIIMIITYIVMGITALAGAFHIIRKYKRGDYDC